MGGQCKVEGRVVHVTTVREQLAASRRRCRLIIAFAAAAGRWGRAWAKCMSQLGMLPADKLNAVTCWSVVFLFQPQTSSASTGYDISAGGKRD